MKQFEEFTIFWNKYPRKESKYAAIRAWERLSPSEEEIQEIMQQLESY